MTQSTFDNSCPREGGEATNLDDRFVESETLSRLFELNTDKMTADRPAVDPIKGEGENPTPPPKQVSSVFPDVGERAGDDTPSGVSFERSPREGRVIKSRRCRQWQGTLRNKFVLRRHSFDLPQSYIQALPKTRSLGLSKRYKFTGEDKFCKGSGRHFKWKIIHADQFDPGLGR